MSKVIVERSGRLESETELGAAPVAIGREAGNDVVLLDPSVSRRHARIDPLGPSGPSGSGYRIIDLDSGNGVIHEAKRVAALDLFSGCSVGIGEFTLRFELDELASVADPDDHARLVIVGGADRAVYVLSAAETVVGRSTSAEICISDPLASSTHFKIVKRGSLYALVDLGSENGTYVNGVRAREKELEGGDQIRIARLTFYFAADGNVPEPGTIELIQPTQSPLPKPSSNVPAPRVAEPPTPAASVPPPVAASEPPPKKAVPRLALAAVGFLAFVLFLVLAILMRSPDDDAEREFQDVFQANVSEEERGRMEEYRVAAVEYEERGVLNLALEQYRKILTLDPTQQEALAESARLEELLEDQASVEAAKALEDRERMAQMAGLTERADALAAEKKFEEARELLGQAMTLSPDSEVLSGKQVEFYVAEGNHLRRRNASRARAAYQKALELAPDHADAKRGVRNIDVTRQAAREKTQRVEELNEAGLVQLRREEYRDAYESFSEVLKLDPNHERAQQFRDQAQGLLEQQVRPIYEDGVRLYNAGELPAAMERFQRALELQPDHADTRSFLSRAIERVRSEAVDRYKRAYIYEGLGRFGEALELYEETLALLPDPNEEYHQKASQKIAELKRKLQ